MGVVQSFRPALWAVLATLVLAPGTVAIAQDTALSDRAKARDANKNGVIDRAEAGGPLADNFAEMDCNKSGGLDGAEIRGFFTGAGCPKKAATAPSGPPTGDRALSARAKARDANKNGYIDRNEAGGPLADNFNEMDCDKSGGLDGAEIRGFFTGSGCPSKSSTATAAPKNRTPRRCAGAPMPLTPTITACWSATRPAGRWRPISKRSIPTAAAPSTARRSGSFFKAAGHVPGL